MEGGGKDTNFFPSVQGERDFFPLPLLEKKSFASLVSLSKSCVSYWNLSFLCWKKNLLPALFLSQKVAFLIGTYPQERNPPSAWQLRRSTNSIPPPPLHVSFFVPQRIRGSFFANIAPSKLGQVTGKRHRDGGEGTEGGRL
ncbi:MAG: hypothetical protein IJ785_03570 [Bacteroidales bacterium]|nr:hypothetical protein [Bacteroidales bacterium]